MYYHSTCPQLQHVTKFTNCSALWQVFVHHVPLLSVLLLVILMGSTPINLHYNSKLIPLLSGWSKVNPPLSGQESTSHLVKLQS